MLLRVVLVVAALTAYCCRAVDVAQMRSAVSALHRAAWDGQWQDNLPFDTFKLQFGHRKGAFKSTIHINFVGEPLLQFMRRDVGVPDDNGFIVPFMIESFVRAHAAQPDIAPLNDERIRWAMESIFDSVRPATPTGGNSSVPVMGFWPWKCEPGKACRQFSQNMNPLMDNMILFADIIEATVNKTGPDGWLDVLAAFMKSMAQEFTLTFNIPPDADDTGMNMAVSRLLSDNTAILPSTNAAVAAKHYNFSAVAQRLAEYAYCPADRTNRSRSSIDPRTYFWAREFFNTLTDVDDCVITTWLQSFDEELGVYAAKSGEYLMPFNVNNVDPTVAGNALYGLNSLLLEGQLDWVNDKTRKMYLTTGRFVAWTISNQPNITRPDLETLYYPNTYNVLAFTARHVRMLRSYNASGKPWPFAEVGQVFEMLDIAMKSGGCDFVQQRVLRDAACAPSVAAAADFANTTCFNGFLGLNDTDADGKPTPHYDDRFFTTAAAAHAMISTNTIDTPDGPRWATGTPTFVKEQARRVVNWLTVSALRNGTSYTSSFFSGSIHAFNTLPFFFPATTIFLMNDTSVVVNCSSTKVPFGDLTFQAVQGQVPESEYQQILRNGCAGVPSEPAYHGLNAPDSPWPFWSSEPLSQAHAMSAIAEFIALDQHN